MTPIKIAPVVISSSRKLAIVGDTMYMLGPQQRILWKWDIGNGADIVDRPIVDAHGFIYVIALDGIIFSLDSKGKQRWLWRLNGASSFSQIKSYINEQYLVVRDNSTYRELRGFDEDDDLYLCKDRDVIATTAFPRNATLRVRGKRIYAITKVRHRTRIKEIRFIQSATRQ